LQAVDVRGWNVVEPRPLRIGFFPERDAAGHINLTSKAVLSCTRGLREHGIELLLNQRHGVGLIWADHSRIVAEQLSGGPLLIDEVTDICQVLNHARRLLTRRGVLGIVKPHVYRPRSIYASATQLEIYQPTAGLPLDTSRLFLSVGYGALERVAPLRQPIDFGSPRHIDVFFAGTVDYADAGVAEHRRGCVTAIEQIKDARVVCISGRQLSTGDFWEHLRKSRICVSPWGWGAACHRDTEAMLAGCVVVKPQCDFVDTWPDVYRANQHYVPCRLDFADLADVVEQILDRWDEYRDAREASRSYLIECARPENVVHHVLEIVRSALNGGSGADDNGVPQSDLTVPGFAVAD
jgi:hypothetical protein